MKNESHIQFSLTHKSSQNGTSARTSKYINCYLLQSLKLQIFGLISQRNYNKIFKDYNLQNHHLTKYGKPKMDVICDEYFKEN